MQCNVPEKIVGILYTPWEFCGALSYIHHLNSHGHFPSVTIFVCKYPDRADFLIPEVDIKEMSVRSVHLDISPENLDTASLLVRMNEVYPGGVGAEMLVSPIYLPLETAEMFKTLTCHAMWHLGTTRPKVIAIDDGVGVHLKPQARKREVVHIGEPGLLNGVLLSALMRGHGGPWTWFTMERGASGRFLPRPNVLESYADFFVNKYWEVFEGRGVLKKHYENISDVRPVMFVSQPLVDDEFCDLLQYQEMVRSAWKMCKEVGLEMVVKLHPRDDVDYIKHLGVPYIDDSAIAEAAMAVLQPRAVIGPYSTSMVNARLIHDIPSASILKACDVQLSQSRELLDYEGLFAEFVEFPPCSKSLKDWLQSLV